jgi:REP element-mobilizing transposase RayT
MPNHIHLIWELKKFNGKESPVGSFKKYTSHIFLQRIMNTAPGIMEDFEVDWKCRDYNFWKPDPDWFALNKTHTVEQKLNYIHNNPMKGKWSLVKHPADYCYSSARFYEHGLKDFDFLYDYRDWK